MAIAASPSSAAPRSSVTSWRVPEARDDRADGSRCRNDRSRRREQIRDNWHEQCRGEHKQCERRQQNPVSAGARGQHGHAHPVAPAQVIVPDLERHEAPDVRIRRELELRVPSADCASSACTSSGESTMFQLMVWSGGTTTRCAGKSVAQQADPFWLGAAIAKPERQHRRLAAQSRQIRERDRDEMARRGLFCVDDAACGPERIQKRRTSDRPPTRVRPAATTRPAPRCLLA